MSTVSRGIGSALTVGATNIGTLTKISSPQMKRDTLDTTILSSPYGFKQFIAALADGGNLMVEGYFDTTDSGQNLLYNKFLNCTIDTYVLTFPTVVGASWTATCLITDLDMGGDADISKALTFKMTLKVSGVPVIATSPTTDISALTLTGASGTLSPTFSNGVYYYAWEFITTTSITVTPTAAGQQYTMYVDGVNQGTVNGGSASAAIPFATAGTSHKIDLIVSEAGYSPLIYTIIAVRTA